MTEGQFVLFLTTIGGIFTTLMSLWVTTYKDKQKEKNDALLREETRKVEERNRQWDLEDREFKARELEKKVVGTAETLASKVGKSHDVLLHEIKENTEISKSAFHEANDAKKTIADLTKIFTEATNAGNKAQSSSNKRLDILENPVQIINSEAIETLERVDETTTATLKEVQKKKK
jgi:hypothetical protein